MTVKVPTKIHLRPGLGHRLLSSRLCRTSWASCRQARLGRCRRYCTINSALCQQTFNVTRRLVSQLFCVLDSKSDKFDVFVSSCVP